MSDLHTTLRRLLAQGPSARQQIDDLLGSHLADPLEDLRTTLDQVDLDQLLYLQQMFRKGRVIAKCYRRCDADGQQRGCLLYWLLDFCSNQDLLNHRFPSEEIFKAAVRTIRFWDSGALTQEGVSEVLQSVVEEQQRPFSEAEPVFTPLPSQQNPELCGVS